MGEALEIMGLINQVYLTNDLMNWADWLNDFCVLIVIEWFLVWPPIYSVSLTFILYWFFPYGSQFKKTLFSNFPKTWSNLHLCGRGPIKSVLFICPSVCLPVCLWHIFLRIYSVDALNFLHEEGYFAIYTKKWQSQIMEMYLFSR